MAACISESLSWTFPYWREAARMVFQITCHLLVMFYAIQCKTIRGAKQCTLLMLREFYQRKME